jgi:cytochrome c553
MAQDHGLIKLERPWPQIGWISFALTIVISSLLGFVVLSRNQLNDQPLGIWDAICRGLGITADTAAARSPAPTLRTPTNVAWTQATLAQVRAGNAQRGNIVAINCMTCHEGTAANPAHLIPTLDGMDSAVIFKQLADYRSGKRPWGVMKAIAQALTVQDSADVAAYFASRTGGLQPDPGLRTPQGGHSLRQRDKGIRLVFAGDEQRGIAPCSACHGPGGYKIGAPPLTGQYPEYIERQLAAFAQGSRQNDINEQMRTIAWQLTPEEIRAVAAFYGTKATPVPGSPPEAAPDVSVGQGKR